MNAPSQPAAPAKGAHTQVQVLANLLQRYVNCYPAFRIKPTGAPGSPAREEQELLMALEDDAVAALRALGERL